MNMLYDWKFYLFVLAIINIIVTAISFLTIKFNDLRHLGKDVTKMDKKVDRIESKVNAIDKESAVQKQRIDDLEKSVK